jgi:hypothetical protein
VPPALDVQLYRPAAGEEWRWIDAAPQDGVSGGTLLSTAAGLLTARDRDETWNVVPLNIELNPTLSLRKQAVSIVLDAPLRATWNDQIGVADPRAGLLLHGGTWGTLRVGGIAPIGTVSWPLTWNDWRVDTAVSLQNRTVGMLVGVQAGKNSTIIRGVVGARIGELRVESTLARIWGDTLDMFTGEVTASTVLTKKEWRISPFVGGGFTPTPGTPAVRAGVSVRRVPKKAVPVPAPLPPPPPLPTPEPPVPPVTAPPPEPPKLKGVTLMVVHLTPPCQDTDSWILLNKERVLAHVARGGVFPEAVSFQLNECGLPLIQAEVVSVR